MNNSDIRLLIMTSGLKHKEVARQMGITPEWFSNVLRRDLKPEMRTRIIEAVEKLKEEDWSGDAIP